MKQAIDDLLRRLGVELGLSLDELFWGTIAFCLIFAAAHLVSMLITRWGDKGATSKSLAFSISAHVALIMTAFGISIHQAASELEQGDQTVIPVRNIVVEGDEGEVAAGGGEKSNETAVFDRIPELEGGGNRAERAPRPLTDAPLLQDLPTTRQDLPIARAETGLLPMSVAPLAAVPAPIADLKPDLPPAPRVAPPEEASGPQPEARTESSIPGSGPARRASARGGDPEPTVARKTEAPSSGTAATVGETAAAPFTADSALATADRPRPLTPSLDGPMGEPLSKSPAPVPTTVDAASLEPAAASSTTGTGDGGGDGGGIRRRNLRGAAEAGDDVRRPARGFVEGGGSPEGVASTRNRMAFDAPANVRSPGVQRVDDGPLNLRGNGGVPATYRLRSLARRREIARKYGGTEASEKAVEQALAWFASTQEKDGSWDGDRFGSGKVGVDKDQVDRKFAGRDADSGITALVVLSFLGAGYTHEEGPYAAQVDKAIHWLISQQRDDGYLGGKATHYAEMYCHGMATYALAEAYGMQSDPAADSSLREALRKATAYTLDMQNSDGGWRYEKNAKESDMSMFGWQLMALKSAEIAGFRIPDDARNRMVQFLKARSRGDSNGLAGYRIQSPVSTSMTAEALFCKQMLGISRNNAQCREAVAYMLARPPKRSATDEYYWYYGTLAMYQYGGSGWTDWNEALRDLLIQEQEKTGDNAGSWEPRGTWGGCGGRLYQTALNTLCLEVYYRFLPLHQLNGFEESAP